jgi:C1A family cysteine protease
MKLSILAVLFYLFQSSNSTILDRFNEWMETHHIIFQDVKHLENMFNNWIENDKFIENINNANLTWKLGHNAFSGMNSEEFGEYMGLNNKMVYNSNLFKVSEPTQLDLNSLPETWDWRSKGVVSNIRDQGQCGSCWAFSGTSTLESATAIKTGVLNDLSEQQGVDCSTIKEGWKDMGCNGGWYYDLWSYITANGGLTSESCYPYTSGVTTKTGTCQKTCKPVSGTKVLSQVKVTPYSDSNMLNALYVNPVSVAIEADTKVFQLYKSGIFSDTGCGTTLDHAVVLVGWGSELDSDYYILRNSWGTSWGESGYMKLARGSEYGKSGMCGVLSMPYYPVV